MYPHVEPWHSGLEVSEESPVRRSRIRRKSIRLGGLELRVSFLGPMARDGMAVRAVSDAPDVMNGDGVDIEPQRHVPDVGVVVRHPAGFKKLQNREIVGLCAGAVVSSNTR